MFLISTLSVHLPTRLVKARGCPTLEKTNLTAAAISIRVSLSHPSLHLYVPKGKHCVTEKATRPYNVNDTPTDLPPWLKHAKSLHQQRPRKHNFTRLVTRLVTWKLPPRGVRAVVSTPDRSHPFNCASHDGLGPEDAPFPKTPLLLHERRTRDYSRGATRGSPTRPIR